MNEKAEIQREYLTKSQSIRRGIFSQVYFSFGEIGEIQKVPTVTPVFPTTHNGQLFIFCHSYFKQFYIRNKTMMI